MMHRALLAFLIFLLPFFAMAEGRQTLGWGRMLDNDLLGDLQDRWRSGSYTVSVIRGPNWTGSLPVTAGRILEYRFSGSAVTPANLDRPAADDRKYVAALSVGLHTHFDWRGSEVSLGGDLAATGPQTGVGRVHSWLHGILGMSKPDLSDQTGNAIYPTLRAELGRRVLLSAQTALRPFVSVQTGLETYVRVGGDAVMGGFGAGGLQLRDDATGQRYRAVAGARAPPLSLTLGGDLAHVVSSALLPPGEAAVPTATRGRLRAGVAWQGATASAFYGVTYLTPEFHSQPEGQLIGSVSLNLRF